MVKKVKFGRRRHEYEGGRPWQQQIGWLERDFK
jgi:hypothetical protein